MSLPPDSTDEFERFREIVFRDPALYARLAACEEVPLLLAAVAAAAAERGCQFSLAQAHWIYYRNRRDWVERILDR